MEEPREFYVWDFAAVCRYTLAHATRRQKKSLRDEGLALLGRVAAAASRKGHMVERMDTRAISKLKAHWRVETPWGGEEDEAQKRAALSSLAQLQRLRLVASPVYYWHDASSMAEYEERSAKRMCYSMALKTVRAFREVGSPDARELLGEEEEEREDEHEEQCYTLQEMARGYSGPYSVDLDAIRKKPNNRQAKEVERDFPPVTVSRDELVRIPEHYPAHALAQCSISDCTPLHFHEILTWVVNNRRAGRILNTDGDRKKQRGKWDRKGNVLSKATGSLGKEHKGVVRHHKSKYALDAATKF